MQSTNMQGRRQPTVTFHNTHILCMQIFWSSWFSMNVADRHFPSTWQLQLLSVQFSSVTVFPPTLWPMDCSTPGFPVLHYLLEFAQTHVHWVDDDIEPSYPLSSPYPAFNISQHHGHFQCISSSHQVTKLLELQLQPQSIQWIFRTDFL